MGKSQLFRKNPPKELIEKIIKYYGFKNLNDKRHFTRNDLVVLNTVEKVRESVIELKKYYIPCKARTYLSSLNEKNVITILRQLLKTIGYTIQSREKYMKGMKFIIYKLCTVEEKTYQPLSEFTKNAENITLHFD